MEPFFADCFLLRHESLVEVSLCAVPILFDAVELTRHDWDLQRREQFSNKLLAFP